MKFLFIYEDKDDDFTVFQEHNTEESLMKSVKEVKARGFSCAIKYILEVKCELKLEPVEVVTDYVFVQV